jgi:hypothetical protein
MQKSNEVLGDDSKANMLGVAFNVNENIAISWNQRDVEIGDDSASLLQIKKILVLLLHTQWVV